MQRTITPTHLKGTVSLLVATVLYASFGLLSRVIGYNLPLYYQNWTRNLFAALLLLWTYRQWKTIKQKDWKWIILRSLAGIAAFQLFFVAVNTMELGLTYFIFYAGSTIGGFALGSLLFKERITPIRLASLCVAALGLIMIYGAQTRAMNPLYLTTALLSGFSTSFWNTITKKITEYDGMQLVFLDCILTVPVYGALSLIYKEAWPLTQVSIAQGASLLMGALFAVTGLLIIYGFRRLDAQVGSLILLSEILFAIIYGYFFYQEIPSGFAAFGGILILMAILLPEINWIAVRQRILYAYRR